MKRISEFIGGIMKLRALLMISALLLGTALFAQNTALHFDGVNDCVAIGNMGSEVTTSYTVEAWINPATTAIGTGEYLTYGRTIFASSTASQSKAMWVLLYGDELRIITFQAYENNNFLLQTSGVNIPANAWTHIAVSAVRSGQTHLYVNGVEYGTGVNSGTAGTWNTTMCIGDLRVNRLINFWGAIDEVRVWNDVRTQAEIQTYMNTPIDPNSDNLVAYYPLDESSGSTATDYAGNYDGTVMNGEVTHQQPAWGAEGPTLPVELSSFTAVLMVDNVVRIMWITQSETDLRGYYVFRGESNNLGEAVKVSPLIEPNNSSSQSTYSYLDEEIVTQGTYYYWLESMNLDGTYDFYGPVSVTLNGGEPNAPEVEILTGLLPVYPNPFNPTIHIPYKVDNDVNVEIKIYNTKGQLVRNWDQGIMQKGTHKVIWNGKDNQDSNCTSGVYLIKMQAGDQSFSTKAILSK